MVRNGTLIGTATLVVAALCLVIGRIAGGDPLMPFEYAAAMVMAVWAGRVALAIGRGHLMGRELDRSSSPWTAFGLDCRVLPGASSAFVVGAFHPRIYLGGRLADRLSPHELRAVLAHEEHHRRHGAPLRAAALQAWLPLIGWWPLAHRLVERRLIDLERTADSYALQLGIERRDLASALMATDDTGGTPGSWFSAYTRERISALVLDDAAPPRQGAPMEWLPVVTALVAALTCHVTFAIAFP